MQTIIYSDVLFDTVYNIAVIETVIIFFLHKTGTIYSMYFYIGFQINVHYRYVDCKRLLLNRLIFCLFNFFYQHLSVRVLLFRVSATKYTFLLTTDLSRIFANFLIFQNNLLNCTFEKQFVFRGRIMKIEMKINTHGREYSKLELNNQVFDVISKAWRHAALGRLPFR